MEPCRNVPFKVYDKYKKELDKLEELDILEKIDEPIEFENAVVLVKKPDGSLRICLDPKNLNDCLMREHFKLPTFEEIRAKMNGLKVFTVLDASKAFHQVELDEDSSKITTFQTPFGRYRYKRMPYGIKTAPEIFHKNFKEIFGNINNVENFMDDLIVWGKDQNEHDNTLRQVLERVREYNVKLNETKCKIGVNKVKFLGHIFTDQGIEVNKEKIEAIMKMERPENVKEMERFLGIINYISKFVSMASSVTAPLREMIKESSQLVWTKEREQAYQEVKIKLTTTPVLQYYDPNMDCKLSVDASGTGVGVVLLQNELPVAYASKALTDTQKAWAQIEKELYAIVFGCERFRQYIYGKKIFIESDHKPLTPILSKPLSTTSVRLQKMRLRLQSYDIDVTYKPGKEMYIADALSRAHDKAIVEDDKDVNISIMVVDYKDYMSEKRLKEFIVETARDEELQEVLRLLKMGWPTEKKNVPEIVKKYHTFNCDLSIDEGLLFKNDRVIVPHSLRKEMLKRLHYSHLGIEKTKNKARGTIYWPGINKQIEEMVESCETCLRLQRSNDKEPLMPHEVPKAPWIKVGTDLLEFRGKRYLLTVDYFSKYEELGYLPNMSNEATISVLKSSFARYGIPKIVQSDGGTQYTS